MPSKSLVSSWTAPGPSPASHGPHVPHDARPGNSPLSHTRLPVLRHLHGLWKGLSFPRKRHSAGGAVLRRASSTINVPGAVLMSMIAPTPSPIISSPSSPTTPRPPPLPSGADTNTPAIIVEADTGSWSLKGLSPVVVPLMRRAAAKPSSTSTVLSTQPVPVSDHHSLLLLSNNMTTSISQPASIAALRAPVSTLDAATRLQHFGAMIAEMRVTLLRCDLEVKPEEEPEEEDQGFRTEKGDDYDDEEDRERERVLRLLEDVTRKVKRLAEDKDPAGLGHPPALSLSPRSSTTTP